MHVISSLLTLDTLCTTFSLMYSGTDGVAFSLPEDNFAEACEVGVERMVMKERLLSRSSWVQRGLELGGRVV